MPSPVPLSVRERGEFEERFPTPTTSAAPGPDPRGSHALAEARCCSASALPQLRLPRLILAPRARRFGIAAAKSLDHLGVSPPTAPTPSAGTYLPRSSPGRLRCLGRHCRRTVRQFLLTLWNTYSFWSAYANAEGARGRPTSATPPGPAQRPRPLGSLTPAGDDRDRARAHGRFRLHRHAGRAIAEYVEEPLQLVRAALPRASGRATRAASRPFAHCLLETAACLAPFVPFSPDESNLKTSPAA